jgi:hypothetical protein
MNFICSFIDIAKFYFNNYVIVVTDVIIFPGTCYVLVSLIQLALACAWKDIHEPGNMNFICSFIDITKLTS